MKATFVIFFALISVSLFAIADQGKVSKVDKIYAEKYGGRIPTPESCKGTIGFLDCTAGVASADIDRVISTLHKELKFNYDKKSHAAIKRLPSHADVAAAGVDIAIFVIESPEFPALLAAPEDRWALVNITKLKEGLEDNVLGGRMLNVRTRAEIMRAFGHVCGNATSQYDGNYLSATDIKSLDATNPDLVVFDFTQRCSKYLKAIGITPLKLVSYQMACQQGWAPAPTNDVQRKIWNQVHEKPSNPIKITFDPKTDTK